MKTNPLFEGLLTENSASLGTVARKVVRERAVELAAINGRSAQDVSKPDWEQAKRELTGEPDEKPSPSSISTRTIADKLRGHPFLKGMDLEHLALLARHARVVEFRPDQVIFRQKENAHQFYLILEGRVAVESYLTRADNITLQILAAGDELGWSWLFPPFAWHFQARALEPATAIFLDGASVLAACERDHSFGYDLMGRIARVVIKRLGAAQLRLSVIQKAMGTLPVVDEPKRVGGTAYKVGHLLEDMLAEHPFLTGIEPAHLRILADAAMMAKFDASQLIFHEGDPANRFYLIQHGKVALEAAGKEPSAGPFQIIGDGEVLGWSWLFPPFYWHFEARALEPTQCIFIYGTRLRETCEQNHELGYALMKRTADVVIQRLQATRERLVEISALKDENQDSIEKRIA